jgi:hypothetical protein
MGEYSFFSGLKRKASAKCKNFTEVMALSKSDFLEGKVRFKEAYDTYMQIRKTINVS